MFALESYQAGCGCNVVLYIVCDGAMSLDSLRQQFLFKLMPKPHSKSQCDPCARLRQLWTKYVGFLFWKWERDFRIEKHIRQYDYSNIGMVLPEEVCSEEDLKRISAPLLAWPFDAGQSPWELLLMEKYKSDDNNDDHPQCVIALRIHNALSDGISILQMLLRLFDHEKEDFAKARFPQLSLARKIGTNLLVTLRGPYDLASKLFVDCYDDSSSNCWCMVDKQRPNEYHTFFSNAIQLEHIKEIVRRHKVCFNAAVYSVTAGATLKLMSEAGQKIPNKLSTLHSYPLPAHPGGLDNYVLVNCDE